MAMLMCTNKKIILVFVFFVFVLSFLSGVQARNFTIYNSSNPSQTYFIVNGDTGRTGIGTSSPANALNVLGSINATGIFYGNGSGLTGILGSQITNDFNWTNWTALSQFTNDLGIGNWTLDKINYYTKTEVDTNLTNMNNSINNWANSIFMRNDGDNVTGQYDFNGGWTSNGLSIIDGDLYAQQGYFYQINSLQVANLEMNGSIIPDMDNQFDLGNSSVRWRDLRLGRDAYINGSVGIGTTNLQYALNVIGGANFTGNIYANGVLLGVGTLSGLGTAWYIPMWNGTNSLNNSVIFQNGSNVGIGTIAPLNSLNVIGDINATTNLYGTLIYQNGNKVLDSLDNVTIYNYIDAQDVLYNNSIKAYVDALNLSQANWMIEKFVPYNNATSNVDLGNYNLSAETLNSSNVNTGNLLSTNVDTGTINVTGNARITGSMILGGANITADTNGNVNIW